MKHIMYKHPDGATSVVPMPDNYSKDLEAFARSWFNFHCEGMIFVDTGEKRYFGLVIPTKHLAGWMPNNNPEWFPKTILWQETQMSFQEVKADWWEHEVVADTENKCKTLCP